MKETDCRKCCVCAFKEDLCNGDFCEKYYREGNAEDFEKLLPHWIPCSERLPEETVLVTVKTKTSKYRYVCEAVWIPRWTWKASFDNWEDCSEYNEDEDEFYVNEGWYERVHNWDEYSYIGIEDEVLAWMPLPEPYKEGEQDD